MFCFSIAGRHLVFIGYKLLQLEYLHYYYIMNPKFRYVYLLLGVIGLAFLIYHVIDTFPDTDPIYVLLITVPDTLFFYLAYKTYPATPNVKRYR